MLGVSVLEEMLFLGTLGISEVELMVGSSCIYGGPAYCAYWMLALLSDF